RGWGRVEWGGPPPEGSQRIVHQLIPRHPRGLRHNAFNRRTTFFASCKEVKDQEEDQLTWRTDKGVKSTAYFIKAMEGSEESFNAIVVRRDTTTADRL